MFSNLPLKVLAVTLALLLWLHVVTEKNYEVEQTLPVALVLTAENRALAAPPPDSLHTLISASGKALLRSGWKKKGVSIRVGETRIGRRELELSADNVAILDGSEIELQSVLAPRNYRFTIDVVDSAMLPVKSKITVVPAAGFVVGSIDSISPAVVQAIGPKSSLQRLTFASVESRTVQDISNDIVLTVALDTSEVYGVRFSPSQVTYRANVTAIRQRVIDSIPVALLNAPEFGADVRPRDISAIVSGALDEIQDLRVADISVTVDFLRRDSAGFAPVSVSLPPRITLVSISDSLAQILIR
jgi:YbbR domain-containing protein